MYIAEMTIKDVPPFTDPVEFKFDEHVNVFIGPNASGKSTLLEQVLVNYNSPDTGGSELSYIDGQPVNLIRGEHCSIVLEDDDDTYDHDNERFNVIIIPASRARYGFLQTKEGLVTASELHTYYGVDSLSHTLYEDYIHGTVSALQRVVQNEVIDSGPALEGQEYSDCDLLHPFVLAKAEENPRKAGQGLLEALSFAHSCAKEICQEVIQGNVPLHKRVVKEVKSESGLPELDAHLDLGVRVQTNDRGVFDLDITALSAGIEGTLWWTRLIALSLVFMHKFEPGWRNRSAILLIDEIENHLHPTWQRRVIPALLDHFPGLQIFATTHSPFVVAGLKAGQVHLLNRDENGAVTATTNTENIEGWTADEILRVFMGVKEPTDERTAKAGAELRRLRDMGTLADEREEEQRQARIRELREIVNIAVLDGPRAAEDARFTENLTRILERYRLSRDLNQENG